MPSEELHKSVERELIEEKAGALARVTRGFEAAMAALEAAEAALAATSADGDERAERLAARRRARQEASRWLWYVIVQRECIGLLNHDALMRAYRVPANLTPSLRPA